MDPSSPKPAQAIKDRSVIEFGVFVFRVDTLELRRNDDPVPLPPKACAVLGALLHEAGGLVTREALYEAAWPRTVIEFDQALNTSIRQLRAALGDDARAPRYIETVPRRGYRFSHPIRLRPVTSALAPRRHLGSPARLAGRGMTRLAVVLALTVAWTAGRTMRLDSRPMDRSASAVPTVEFDGSEADAFALAGIVDALETSVRAHWTRAVPSEGHRAYATGDLQDLLVTGSVVPAEDGARLHALILRVSDGSVLWAGTFNPLCPQAQDPVGVIGYHVALQLRRSVESRS